MNFIYTNKIGLYLKGKSIIPSLFFHLIIKMYAFMLNSIGGNYFSSLYPKFSTTA